VVTETPVDPDPRELDPSQPLPKGRHALAPEAVARHQRDRIVAAVAVVIAEHGYGGLNVGRIIAVARVSRSTFYLHFSDKSEAVIGAHAQIFARLRAQILQGCEEQSEWAEKVKAAVGAVLAFAAAEPAQAKLISASFFATDRSLEEHARVSLDEIAELLRAGRRLDPSAAPLPAMTEEAMVGAIAAVLARGLADSAAGSADGLGPQLSQLVLIPYLGRTAAAEGARLA
jgi:AcrR family transcriptional regulator